MFFFFFNCKYLGGEKLIMSNVFLLVLCVGILFRYFCCFVVRFLFPFCARSLKAVCLYLCFRCCVVSLFGGVFVYPLLCFGYLYFFSTVDCCLLGWFLHGFL